MNNATKDAITSILNSNIFSWFYFCFSDCYHLTQTDFTRFKIDLNQNLINAVSKTTDSLMKSINDTSIYKLTNYKTKGMVEYQEFYPRYSKQIIDQIDCLLAQNYGFTHEELDFIINYDIKYRMGKELNSEKEDEANEG